MNEIDDARSNLNQSRSKFKINIKKAKTLIGL